MFIFTYEKFDANKINKVEITFIYRIFLACLAKKMIIICAYSL